MRGDDLCGVFLKGTTTEMQSIAQVNESEK